MRLSKYLSQSYNKRQQAENLHYAALVLLAKAQTLTPKQLRASFSCAGRYTTKEK